MLNVPKLCTFNNKNSFIPKKKKEAQLMINFNQLIWFHKALLQGFRHLEIAPKGGYHGFDISS